MIAIDRPSLSELRARVHKEHHREIGNWLARRWGRPAAVYGTWLAVRLKVSANQATLAALVSTGLGCASIASGDRTGFILGVILLHAAFLLDHVDGQLARWRGKASLDGVYFDYLFHHFYNICLGFALGYGLSLRLGEPVWTLAGFLAALGWTVLSLHNDCRYKAMFQRLKSDKRRFRVQSGSGGRPSPPAPRPKRASRAALWALFKACEPHFVLMALTLAACAALASIQVWVWIWKAGLAFYAASAPLLACGRAAKSICGGSVEREFEAWFQEDKQNPCSMITR